MSARSILYLCPDYARDASTGGLQAHGYFIGAFSDALEEGLIVAALSSEVVGDISPQRNAVRIFPTANGRSISRLLHRTLMQLRYIKFPNKVSTRINAEARATVRRIIKEQNLAAVVIDHFDALSLIDIKTIVRAGLPLIYIAHNHETRLVHDIANELPLLSLRKWATYVDRFRTSWHEMRLLKVAKCVIFLSHYDLRELRQHTKSAYSFAHLPVKFTSIRSHNRCSDAQRSVIFGCNASFLPNREALEWTATRLAPALLRLRSPLVVKVTGVSTDEVPRAWLQKNMKYLGFLTKQNYIAELASSSAFLCPIVLGSGVKMKIIEAMSHGLPVFATEHSWRGITHAPDEFILSRDPDEAAMALNRIVTDSDLLTLATYKLIESFRSGIQRQSTIRDIINTLGINTNSANVR